MTEQSFPSDWQEQQLSELGALITGATPKTSEAENFGDFIPFIKPSDFFLDGSLNYDNEGLSEVGLRKSRREIPKNSILMVCIGATIGKAGVCDRTISANQQINALIPNDGINSKFIYYQVLSGSFRKAMLLEAGQATLPIISKSKWGN